MCVCVCVCVCESVCGCVTVCIDDQCWISDLAEQFGLKCLGKLNKRSLEAEPCQINPHAYCKNVIVIHTITYSHTHIRTHTWTHNIAELTGGLWKRKVHSSKKVWNYWLEKHNMPLFPKLLKCSGLFPRQSWVWHDPFNGYYFTRILSQGLDEMVRMIPPSFI